jgi:hypothetical protein
MGFPRESQCYQADTAYHKIPRTHKRKHDGHDETGVPSVSTYPRINCESSAKLTSTFTDNNFIIDHGM